MIYDNDDDDGDDDDDDEGDDTDLRPRLSNIEKITFRRNKLYILSSQFWFQSGSGTLKHRQKISLLWNSLLMVLKYLNSLQLNFNKNVINTFSMATSIKNGAKPLD